MNENILERSLRMASGEPTHRQNFYKILLESNVYVIGEGSRTVSGSGTLAPHSNLPIRHWRRQDGSSVIPFFSSLEVFCSSINKIEQHIELHTRDLFEITRGMLLVLNPFSSFSKEFTPKEILFILNGENYPTSNITEAPTEMLIGNPKVYPIKMMDSLIAIFRRNPDVRFAYIQLIRNISTETRPHFIIGIEFDGTDETILREAGFVARAAAPECEPVDITRVINGQEGLSAHFNHNTKPFYRR